MELKHQYYRLLFHFHFLLIVPYGIETIFHIYSLYFIALLIVPYGIET